MLIRFWLEKVDCSKKNKGTSGMIVLLILRILTEINRKDLWWKNLTANSQRCASVWVWLDVNTAVNESFKNMHEAAAAADQLVKLQFSAFDVLP